MSSALTSEWKRRLIAMVEDPPYVFRGSPQPLIDAHRARLTTFAGSPEAEIRAAEERLGGAFPAAFRAYLAELGAARGELFCGSELASPALLPKFADEARELMAQTDRAPALPSNAAVFLIHQGYSIAWICATGGDDAPVWAWQEGDAEIGLAARSFAALVDHELQLMERNHATAHERGGYYVTLLPGGRQMTVYPALANEDRPLDRRAKGREWLPFEG